MARGRDQHGGHDQLGQYGPDKRVGARGRKVGDGQLLLDDGALLEEDHPRHDHRADIGGDEIEIFLSPKGMSATCAATALGSG